jgi:hypothetical protein
MTATIGALKGIESKVAAGDKLSAGEQKISDRVSQLVGKGAGTDAKVLGSLVGAGEKMLGALNSNIPAQSGGNSSSDYAHTEPGVQHYTTRISQVARRSKRKRLLTSLCTKVRMRSICQPWTKGAANHLCRN